MSPTAPPDIRRGRPGDRPRSPGPVARRYVVGTRRPRAGRGRPGTRS